VAAFTLDYWIDDGWYVGKLREVPGIFSQGKTLDELKPNIEDALELVLEAEFLCCRPMQSRRIAFNSCPESSRRRLR